MKTVTSTYLHGLYHACINLGADADELLLLIPGGKKALKKPEQRFAIGYITQILASAMQTSGRPDIGLHIGYQLRPFMLGEFGQALLFCPTVRDAINLQAKYLLLSQQVSSISLKVMGDEAYIIRTCAYDNPTYSRVISEITLVSQNRIAQWLTWPEKHYVTAVHMSHAKPDYADEYSHFFDCPVLFDQEYDATIIDAKLLELRLPQANKKTLAEICRRLDWEILDLTSSQPAHEQVSRYLATMIGDTDYSITALADIMAMSERSLRRQLSLEGTNYRQLLEQARRSLCSQYLTKGQHSFHKISERLGYSEQSAFNRAFKQWHGQTPKKYIETNFQ